MESRLIKPFITKWMFKKKAIVITGARQVGKTTLVQNIIAETEKPALYLNADEPGVRQLFSDLTVQGLKNLVGSYKILVIDEVQRIENAGIALKLLVDNLKEVQVIATGSSSLEISDKLIEPLTGRHFLFHLYPFSIAELYPQKSAIEVNTSLDFHLVYGSYPDICNNRPNAETLLKNLAGQYLYKDVLAWKEIRKPDLLDKLLQLLAHQTCSEVSLHELATQLKVKTETVDNYIDILEKSFVVYRLKSFATNDRKEISKMKKILFWDNGIRNAILDDFRPMNMRQDTGVLWENFMLSERIKMNNYLQKSTKSYFWRSMQQQEVDYVEFEKNKLSAFEMKYNTNKRNYVTKAFTNLYPNANTQIINPADYIDFVF
jgi:uncharacterized protein